MYSSIIHFYWHESTRPAGTVLNVGLRPTWQKLGGSVRPGLEMVERRVKCCDKVEPSLNARVVFVIFF